MSQEDFERNGDNLYTFEEFFRLYEKVEIVKAENDILKANNEILKADNEMIKSTFQNIKTKLSILEESHSNMKGQIDRLVLSFGNTQISSIHKEQLLSFINNLSSSLTEEEKFNQLKNYIKGY